MNPKLDFIFSRRSVRAYTEKDIEPATVKDLLEAAMAAPSAGCTDPWEFIVVRKAGTRAAMAEILPYGKMLNQAPMGIVVCGNLERAHGGELSYMLQDNAAAIENLLLAANALGLGACWLGVYPRSERIDHLTKLFSLPKSIVPISVIALGWPAQQSPARTRFQELFVHYEIW